MTRFFTAVLFLACLPGTGAFGDTAGANQPVQRPYRVLNYAIRIEIDPARVSRRFEADTEVKFQALQPFEKLVLDAEELKVSKVMELRPDIHPLKFHVTPQSKTVEIQLPSKMRKGETWSVSMHYSGLIHDSHDGFFRVSDPDDKARGPLLFTMFESQSARQFFPCDDEPSSKATTEVEATVPIAFQVISNGKQVLDRKFENHGGPWHTVHWKMDKPHSTYLVSLAIGKFANIAARSGSTPITVWTNPSRTDQAKYVLGSLQDSLGFFEQYLGVKYPWPKYALVLVPTFLWGGMENTSATHQNERRSLLYDPKSELEKNHITELSAHELAHHWFGDYVTMAWWDDVWLNEAFASLMATEASHNLFKNNQSEIATVVDAWNDYFRQENGSRSHPIVDKSTSPDDGFDEINYTKGEQVLRMLKFWMGEPAFRKGLQAYLTSHAYGNATNVDFFNSMEKASGKSMAAFRDSWLLKRGYPVLTYGGEWQSDKKAYQLNLSQRSNHAEDKTIFHFPIPVAFHRRAAPAYDKTVVVSMEDTKVTQSVPLNDEPEWITVNPGGASLVELVPADRDNDKLTKQALQDPDDIARVGATFALMGGLIQGESISSDAQKTVLDVVSADPSPYVRVAVLRQFDKIKTRWLPGKIGDGVLKLVKSTAQPEFEQSPFFTADKHGGRQYRAELLGALGHVDSSESLTLLSDLLLRKDLGLDDLTKASRAAAAIGDDKSVAVLRAALALHKTRGHAYEYAVESAFGAYENPKGAAEIETLSKTAGQDLLGSIGGIIRDNQTLKNSPEWAQFVQGFVLKDTRFDDEIKSRILETIEDVHSDSVKSVLQTIEKQAKSQRLQEDSKRILGKNFSES